MSDRSGHHQRRHSFAERQECEGSGSRWIFGGFWLILFVGTLLVAAPWAGFHGVLLGCTGLLILLCPPALALPRHWWILAAVFSLLGAGWLLPADWFPRPEWRQQLEALGVETGNLVAIQSRQAAEAFLLFVVMLLTGLWLAGHRASPSQLRLWALTFTIGVAAYAIISKSMEAWLQTELGSAEGHFGFFPNRNHSGTYMAMGTVCGLGSALQAMRDKRFFAMGLALAATGTCLLALAAWSVSRGGVVLFAIGCLLWFPMLGRRYLGKHGLWAVGLMTLSAIGLFFIADSGVKERLKKTVAMAEKLINPEAVDGFDSSKPSVELAVNLDFRIPVALDTIDMIRVFPWTGIGPGQFYFVFPQYRKRTIVAQDPEVHHPESDWLWMAAEAGIPATLALAVLMLLAIRKSHLAILRGKDRALRSACLVAAMLVPLHGIFDVPGHRIPLAWGAAFLFTLSLHIPSGEIPQQPPRALFSRVFALVLLLAAAFLIRAQWFGGPQPALATASHALEQAKFLYQQDLALEKQAESVGSPYEPDPKEDRLEQALVLLDEAESSVPLSRDLLRYEAFLALHFEEKSERVERAFAVDRALLPGRIVPCLRQAETLLKVNPQLAARIAREALVRSESLTRIDPHNRWREQQVRLIIGEMAAKSTEPQFFSFLNK